MGARHRTTGRPPPIGPRVAGRRRVVDPLRIASPLPVVGHRATPARKAHSARSEVQRSASRASSLRLAAFALHAFAS